MQISRLDKLNICKSFSLSNDDINTLNLLYMPIIGSKALTVYMLFDSLINRSNFESNILKHSDILDLLGFKLDVFITSKKILEGIGLLSSFKNEETYLYILRQPLSPKNFLKSNVHGLMLYSKIGEELYNFLRDKFSIKKLDIKAYENISASFDDVFKVNVDSTPNNDDYLINKDDEKQIEVKNYDFNFTLFASKIDPSFLKSGITNEFKNLIITTALNYTFDESDMVSLYNDSIDTDSLFKDKLLKKKAMILFKFKNNNKIPKFEIKEEPKLTNSEHADAIKEIEEATGEDFLVSIMGDEYNTSYLDELNKLYDKINLNPSVIRIMIMYVLKLLLEKNGKIDFPSISYFTKVADDWILNGITDVYTAYNYAFGNDVNQVKPKKIYHKKVIRKPGKYEEENKKKDIMEGVDVL